MSPNGVRFSSSFDLFAHSDFMSLPVEVKGLVVQVFGSIRHDPEQDLGLAGVGEHALIQALKFVCKSLMEVSDSPQQLSPNPEAVRKRAYRAAVRDNPRDMSHAPLEQPPVPLEIPSQPLRDMSHDPCLSVNRILKGTNKQTETAPVLASELPETVPPHETVVLAALQSHDNLALAATPQLAKHIAREAPDVDPHEVAKALARQFEQRPPRTSLPGYIRAAFRKQQEQRKYVRTSKDEPLQTETSRAKAKTLPLAPRPPQQEEVLKPLLAESLPDDIRQDGLSAVADILAHFGAVA